MNIIKLLMLSLLSLSGNAQLMGAQKDPSGNGCVLDGGYSWCPSLNKCVRPWIETCADIVVPINHIMEPGPVIIHNKYSKDENLILNIGDICYRFCEDNSQSYIDNKFGCPSRSKCISTFNQNSVSMIAYDSCDDRAWTCQMIDH